MYYCFGKGDWDRGVPMLALGSDSLLKSVARKELLEDCSSVADQVSLGDAWYDLAQTKTGFAKSAIHRRAIHWYCRALPSLTGLTRDKVDGRLRRMEGGAQPSAAPVAETPQPTIPVPAPPPVLPKQPAQAIRPGYSLVWQGRNGQYVEARDVGARSWVDVDLRAHGFEQASQAKAILDLQTPKVIRKVQANNPQVRLVVKRQYDTKAGEVFIRNIRLGADN
jgi:hypothetical protein